MSKCLFGSLAEKGRGGGAGLWERKDKDYSSIQLSPKTFKVWGCTRGGGKSEREEEGKQGALPSAVFSTESLSSNQQRDSDEQRGLATPTLRAVWRISIGICVSYWQSTERN